MGMGVCVFLLGGGGVAGKGCWAAKVPKEIPGLGLRGHPSEEGDPRPPA